MREDSFCFKGYGVLVSTQSILLGAVLAGLASQAVRAQDIYEIDLFKRSWYVQNGNAAPVPVPGADDPVDISAYAFISSDADPEFFQGMTMKTPGGLTQGMQPGDTYFSFYDGYVLASQLNVRYGPGTYRFTLSDVTIGTLSWNVPLAADNYPPAPKILNTQAGQSIDPSKDFTLQWTGFSGAGQLSTEVYLMDVDSSGVIFDSGPLSADQTTSTIPASTLEAGKSYLATVHFTRANPSTSGSANVVSGFQTATSTILQTSKGSPPAAPVIQSITLQGDGSVQLSVTCTAGTDLVVQGTTQIGGTWNTLQTVTPQSSPATITLTAADLGTIQVIRAYQ